MTPKQIVEELDVYIVGQSKAKRALALAIRDRLRRQKLPKDIADEIRPRNVILIGSTGIGKTELARRLAKLSDSPFIKVEASKFTEVGYVGRDVDSIIRDLTENAVEMIRQKRVAEIGEAAEQNAEDRILEILAKKKRGRKKAKTATSAKTEVAEKNSENRLEKLRKDLQAGKLNKRVVELEVQERYYETVDSITIDGDDEMEIPLRDLLVGMLGNRTFKKKMPVEEAIDYLITEEEAKLIDMEQVTKDALDKVEHSAIVFIDELDKIAGREGGNGPEVSRQGVQRDILPIVEGSSVGTRYGTVRTDQILFIAAGAFHVSSPSDLIPELQGRFPVRVEMDSLTEEDFVRILSEPKNALIKQYTALLETEGIKLEFEKEAIEMLAHFATTVNQQTEDIGARRLHTVMEALLEEISFEGCDSQKGQIVITAAYVKQRLAEIVKDNDLSRYIL
ncbi:MAG: ATP-dependent protease ATPase subunit HslU [Acidobacteriota bacterium]|nr:MAG: ATP-dependent protease ATPase subunit HslU [Acidobacteriota bacterium]